MTTPVTALLDSLDVIVKGTIAIISLAIMAAPVLA